MNEIREHYLNPFTTMIAKFTQEELLSYENSLKYYRDLKNSLDLAREEGKLEGKIEEKMEVIQKGKEEGLSIEILVKLTGLSRAEVEKIIKES